MNKFMITTVSNKYCIFEYQIQNIIFGFEYNVLQYIKEKTDEEGDVNTA